MIEKFMAKIRRLLVSLFRNTIFFFSFLLSMYALTIIIMSIVFESAESNTQYVYSAGLCIMTILFIVYITTREKRIKRLNDNLIQDKIKLEKLRYKNELLVSILDLLKAVVNEQKIEKFLDIVTENACKLLKVNYSSCFLYNDKTKLLECISTYNVSNSNILDAKILEKSGIIGFVFDKMQPLLLNDPIDKSIFNNFIPKELPIKSAGCIPLMGMNKKIGVLNVTVIDNDKVLDEDDLSLLKVMGFFIATAYEKLENLDKLNKLMSKLEEEKEFVNRVISSMDEMLIAIASDGHIKLVNKSVCNILGYNEDELLKKPFGMILGKGFDNELIGNLDKNPDSQSTVGHELNDVKMSFLCKDLKEVPVNLSFSQLKGNDGSVDGILFIAKDLQTINTLEQAKTHKKESLELSEIYEKMEIQNFELKKKKTELIRLNIEFAQLFKRLKETKEKALQNTSDFGKLTTNLCYEMETPLKNLYKEIEEIANELKDNKIAIFISNVKENILFIETILNGLKTYSECIMGEYNFEDFGMRRVVEEALLRFRSMINETSATIDIDNDLPHAVMDADKIKIALGCLIENAIRFRKSGFKPKIKIGSEICDKEIKFSISDNGIGINNKDADIFFDVSSDVHREFPKTSIGKGMGLAIAKKIIEEHKGRIWFDSKIGIGTTFYFTLPSNRREEA